MICQMCRPSAIIRRSVCPICGEEQGLLPGSGDPIVFCEGCDLTENEALGTGILLTVGHDEAVPAEALPVLDYATDFVLRNADPPIRIIDPL